jgi:hypothetical protein
MHVTTTFLFGIGDYICYIPTDPIYSNGMITKLLLLLYKEHFNPFLLYG